jgi:hypothetical protein
MVIANKLWGYFGHDTTVLDPHREIEADRKYFLEEHGLEMAIAIDSTEQIPSEYRPGRMDYKDDRISLFFAVTGYPTFYLIDHNGVIRERFMGYNEKGINAAIEKLLQESSRIGADNRR